MQTEIEAKFLRLNHDGLRTKLKSLGAVLEKPMRTMTRVNMDFEGRPLEKSGGWVRIRDNGDQVTLTYKQLKSWTVDGVKEAEAIVSGFAEIQAVLEAIGLKVYARQITRRETWRYKEVELALDEWPWVKPFLEIEGPNEQLVREVAKDLGLSWENAMFGSVEPVYIAEFDITEQEFYSIEHIDFDNLPPAWLEERRRK